jgi:hypothetical protein
MGELLRESLDDGMLRRGDDVRLFEEPEGIQAPATMDKKARRRWQ